MVLDEPGDVAKIHANVYFRLVFEFVSTSKRPSNFKVESSSGGVSSDVRT